MNVTLPTAVHPVPTFTIKNDTDKPITVDGSTIPTGSTWTNRVLTNEEFDELDYKAAVAKGFAPAKVTGRMKLTPTSGKAGEPVQRTPLSPSLLLFGPQGTGKAAIARKLCKLYNLHKVIDEPDFNRPPPKYDYVICTNLDYPELPPAYKRLLSINVVDAKKITGG